MLDNLTNLSPDRKFLVILSVLLLIIVTHTGYNLCKLSSMELLNLIMNIDKYRVIYALIIIMILVLAWKSVNTCELKDSEDK